MPHAAFRREPLTLARAKRGEAGERAVVGKATPGLTVATVGHIARQDGTILYYSVGSQVGAAATLSGAYNPREA